MSELTQIVRLGIVTGLVREAACLKVGARRLPPKGRPLIFAAAGEAGAAEDAARQMIAEGATGLVSFGIAGGLDPSLGPGVVVIADRVIAPDGASYPCHDPWVARLMQADGSFDSGAVMGSDVAVMTAARKAALYRSHGALAVDMESHAVARAAKAAGVPFIAVRAVGDPAGRSVPRSALAGLSPDGRTHALPVLRALIKNPRDIPAIYRLARDTNTALAALKRVAAGRFLDLLSEA
jgi:adenosylhomocysteine nucleosidase